MKRVTEMPQVQLEEISFNHPGAKPGGSISISQGGKAVTVPEWQRGKLNAENSLVAYAFKQLKQVITVAVRLSCPDKSLKQVEVEAIADAKNVLGNVQRRTVKFDDKGQSEILPFTVPTPRFAETGVTEGLGSWKWQYQVQANGPWIPFETTEHQLYVLVDAPVDPWDSQLTPVEVLDVSCGWAKGANSGDEAASRITEAVHRLGEPEDQIVTYDFWPTYAHGTFDISGFLRLLRDRGGDTPQTINCDDCATIVSTFANILGSDLFQSEMGNFIHTHYINLIGKPKWGRVGFPRHAVAWKPPCLAENAVFDACLKIDTDEDPGDHTYFEATVPTRLPFAGENNYRFCFFRKGSCRPKPEKKKRRPLGKGFLGQVKETDVILLALLKDHYDFETWPSEEPAADLVSEVRKGLIESLPNFPEFHGWRFLPLEEFENEELEGGRVLLKRDDIITRNLIEISVYETKQAGGSNEFVLQLLAQSHQLNLKRETINPLGRLTFVAPCDGAVIFVRHDLILIIRSVGKESVGVFAMAKAIDKYLAGK